MPDKNSQRSVMANSPNKSSSNAKTVLWWSRSGRDYSRDRIVRNAFRSQGWQIEDFQPTFSGTARVEAFARKIRKPDLVWVPSFRQRDVVAAQKWAKNRNTPIVFDPLISAWDKQVFERKKFGEETYRAKRLLRIESMMLRQCDVVIADTESHAELFCGTHKVPRSNVAVIPVSAEESLFARQPSRPTTGRPQILFFGSFIGLQGPQHIAQAAVQVKEADWYFIGTGPLLEECTRIAASASNVNFLPRVAYEELPSKIGQADILMGIFGDSAKAGRVIPNKVYQSMACGRPVVTRQSPAYPTSLRQQPSIESGLSWTEAADADSIQHTVRAMISAGSENWQRQGQAALATYKSTFSNARVASTLSSVIERLSLQTRERSRAA